MLNVGNRVICTRKGIVISQSGTDNGQMTWRQSGDHSFYRINYHIRLSVALNIPENSLLEAQTRTDKYFKVV